ncbi:glutathione peroxidase [Faecalibacter macacae]|uniref:Glutathione peroxidase n=1 Tax=Faecalibacter macacae TaxID=1859289 RepID=A0A3L9MAN7_9FLAO|nr:glutathione peroxidase [Faecalibacter macacae]RLZ09822.1 glutathione peroxidase [Faecalibacter macacae]
MKYIFIALLCVFTSCNAQGNKSNVKSKSTEMTKKMKTIYDYNFEDIDGNQFSFSDLKGKKIIILNTASKCGYTKQYDALEKVYQSYKQDGLVVIGFPSDNFGGQEFDNNDEIASYCKLNYGVSFPLMTKSNVKGTNQNEIFKFLTQKTINGKSDFEVKWNFTKFLINEDGTLETSYPSNITPDDPKIIDWIENK